MDNRNLGFGHGSEGYNNHNFVPNGEPAENTQGQNVFFQNGEWAYRLAASLQHLGNNEDGENVQVSMNNETEVEEIMKLQGHLNMSNMLCRWQHDLVQQVILAM